MEKFKVLILAGPSGAGKSFIEKELVTKYPQLFHKLPQITTREMRPNETRADYLFVSKEMFISLNCHIIGQTKTPNGQGYNYYGTLPDFRQDKINTVILNEEGYANFVKYADVLNFDFYEIGFDVKKNSIEIKRKDRDEKYIDSERKVLENANIVYYDHSCTAQKLIEDPGLKEFFKVNTELLSVPTAEVNRNYISHYEANDDFINDDNELKTTAERMFQEVLTRLRDELIETRP